MSPALCHANNTTLVWWSIVVGWDWKSGVLQRKARGGKGRWAWKSGVILMYVTVHAQPLGHHSIMAHAAVRTVLCVGHSLTCWEHRIPVFSPVRDLKFKCCLPGKTGGGSAAGAQCRG